MTPQLLLQGSTLRSPHPREDRASSSLVSSPPSSENGVPKGECEKITGQVLYSSVSYSPRIIWGTRESAYLPPTFVVRTGRQAVPVSALPAGRREEKRPLHRTFTIWVSEKLPGGLWDFALLRSLLLPSTAFGHGAASSTEAHTLLTTLRSPDQNCSWGADCYRCSNIPGHPYAR